MPDGGALRLKTRYDKERECVVVEVIDSGVGMDKALKERVFEPFFTTKTGSGSGLGLSIVYGFVKQSGGDIELTSAPGKGTSFVLYLPTHARERLSDDQPPAPIEGVASQSVLLVEDDTDVRLAIADLLRSSGHAVTVAANAEEALNLLEHTYQSVLLSDVDLGNGMHGVELMRRVAQRYPCLLYTSDAADDEDSGDLG